jgi:hypothetical protein
MQGSQQAIQVGQKDEKGRNALSLPRQVLERTTGLSQAVFLGAVEPEEVTTMSDKEMLGEIRETQAAGRVLPRRAKGVGLEGELPADRLMTEGELDNLSEQLGDGPGSRAKRREEVERMSIAEMEAELRGVRNEIRRRRSMGASRLPLMLMLLCLLGQAVEGFTAYDCSNRSNIVESYSLLEPDACANMGKEGEVETTVYRKIVQIKQDRMIPVFRCIVIANHITVLRHVLGGRRCEVYPVPGAQDIGNLGVPPGEEERKDYYQRQDFPGQDRGNSLA